MTELDRFLAARDALQARSHDYEAAVAGFHWPVLEHFNWALDYFDSIARDNPAPALRILEESGTESSLTYAQLSARSSQVAHFLQRQGAVKGDRVLLMLGNEVPLWEVMLASIKLGLVVIPATTLLSGPDLLDRLERGHVAFVITNPAAARTEEVSVQAVVLQLLEQLRAELGLSLLFVSHDLNVVRLLTDRVAVMYLGKLVEIGPSEQVFRSPKHPYTQSLVSAIPGQGPRIRLSGEVASPIDPSPQACRFHGRCPRGEDRCGREAPVLRAVGPQLAACHFIERLAP